ncbi:uncharacterized protein LOC135078575 [Ostrinia nubilalis]|uniref:uncharacterized protein LOC135078575 n=1 Tax=Ostrinia nubilalis TaxID=29057 RepID=UPI0030825179
MALKRQRRFDANKRYQKEISDQAREVAERNRSEYETELNLQKLDNIKANEEMAAIKKFEEDFKAAEKNRIWSDMQRSRQENEQRRREQAARDNMDDRLIDVLLRSRARVEQKRKQTEKDVSTYSSQGDVGRPEESHLVEQATLAVEEPGSSRSESRLRRT